MITTRYGVPVVILAKAPDFETTGMLKVRTDTRSPFGGGVYEDWRNVGDLRADGGIHEIVDAIQGVLTEEPQAGR